MSFPVCMKELPESRLCKKGLAGINLRRRVVNESMYQSVIDGCRIHESHVASDCIFDHFLESLGPWGRVSGPGPLATCCNNFSFFMNQPCSTYSNILGVRTKTCR